MYSHCQHAERILSFSDLSALAKSGDAEAQAKLGELYSNGDGVAQLTIGAMYYKGEGVVQNTALAKEWLKQAADNGNMALKLSSLAFKLFV